MANVHINVLDAAHADGLIRASLTPAQCLYLKDTVLTVSKILEIVASADELDLEQLVARSGLNSNTLKIYLRWLASKGYIRVEKDGPMNLYSMFK